MIIFILFKSITWNCMFTILENVGSYHMWIQLNSWISTYNKIQLKDFSIIIIDAHISTHTHTRIHILFIDSDFASSGECYNSNGYSLALIITMFRSKRKKQRHRKTINSTIFIEPVPQHGHQLLCAWWIFQWKFIHFIATKPNTAKHTCDVEIDVESEWMDIMENPSASRSSSPS